MRDTRVRLGRLFNRAVMPSVVDGPMKVHHTATEDSAWDGPAAEAAMPNDDTVLKYCFAWCTPEAAKTPHEDGDADADDKKSNYKFPHHRTKGGPANIPACRNGLARLENSSIPDGDKPGVRAHLQAHIDDYNKKNGDGDASDSVTTFLARRRESLKAQGKPTTSRRWYSINARAATPDEVDIMITGEIGWDVDAGMFARALAEPNVANASVLHVSLNSVGGDVFDGIGIYNSLVGHGGRIEVTVTGIAASIASVIMMAGDTVIMGRGAQVMIHDAHAIQIGNADDMRQMAEILDRASDNIAGFYADRAGGDPAEWRSVMRDEKWYNAQEAVDAGLADEVAPVRERVEAASPITLAAKVRRPVEGQTYDKNLRPTARATAPAPVATSEVFDFAAAMREVATEVAKERTVADNPLAGMDLGADIRSAVAFAGVTMPEPKTPPVTPQALPEKKYSDLADLRRAIKEG